VLSFLINQKKCTHDKIIPSNSGNYCPDCGKQVVIQWHIVRCDGCCSKRKSYLVKNKLSPVENFCTKCGSPDYYVEEKEQIEFFDYDYATMIREEIREKQPIKETIQVWIEEESRNMFSTPRLLTVN